MEDKRAERDRRDPDRQVPRTLFERRSGTDRRLGQNLEILFVDGDREQLSIVKEYLSPLGYKITVTDDGLNALELIKEKIFGIVFANLDTPTLSGLELVSAIKEFNSEIEVIITASQGDMESAIQALRLRSYDYILKPLELDQVKRLTDRIIEKKTLLMENISLKRRIKERYRYSDIIGISSRMQEIYEIIQRVSQNDSTILIQGESGTGKELLAKTIHEKSNRRNKPFVPVYCGAIVETLLESELFGHRKGAFSGAIRDNIGLFRAANGGTIFLDEIAEISHPVQVKLLRTLQERKVRPVGDTKEIEIEIDVGVIAATNRDIEDAIKSGDLREDLFYRLNVISIVIPPLRERKEDIPFLVNYFVDVFNTKSKRTVKGVSPEAMESLLSYHWPGNVRELQSVIERAFSLGVSETIGIADLPSEVKRHEYARYLTGSEDIPTLMECEITLIRRALERTNGKKVQAAKLLGIDKATLYRKIKKYRLLAAKSEDLSN
ncbi:MAG: sigma-54 dependent transcriptional regulator [Nitrospirota bacterium]